ncbi:hypothetical protein BGZ76_004238 [Entomortierella beljakovae]|nr:hypothetical protein BGZ76_004238 [Entomortierella beljakovae]
MGYIRNALNLPEVRIHLAQYLSTSQLASSAVVCKSWHATFNRFLYSDIVIDGVRKSPSTKEIITNASSIKYLEFSAITCQPYTQFPWQTVKALSRLSIATFGLQVQTIEQIINLISINPGLEVFEDHSGRCVETRECVIALSQCQKLTKLSVSYAGFERSDATELLYDLFTHLEELELSYSSVAESENCHWRNGQDIFSSMKTLRFDHIVGFTTQQQLEFFQRCPQLESLHWSANYYDCDQFPASDICQLLTSFCPRLTDLALNNMDRSTLTNSELVSVFNASKNLAGFSVWESEFGSRAFQALRHHFGKLKNLDLGKSPNITSPMVQTIMTSCPELLTFSAPMLKVEDIIGCNQQEEKAEDHTIVSEGMKNGGSWICLNLRELRVFLTGMRTAPIEWQHRVLGQIAGLRKLEVLDLGVKDGKIRGYDDGIDLRLEAGLDILRGLKRLKTVVFKGLQQNIDENEIAWMTEEWPDLASLIGLLNPVKSKRKDLCWNLFDRRITVNSN